MSKPELRWEKKLLVGYYTLIALTDSPVSYGIGPCVDENSLVCAIGCVMDSKNPVVFCEDNLTIEAAKAACERHWKGETT